MKLAPPAGTRVGRLLIAASLPLAALVLLQVVAAAAQMVQRAGYPALAEEMNSSLEAIEITPPRKYLVCEGTVSERCAARAAARIRRPVAWTPGVAPATLHAFPKPEAYGFEAPGSPWRLNLWGGFRHDNSGRREQVFRRGGNRVVVYGDYDGETAIGRRLQWSHDGMRYRLSAGQLPDWRVGRFYPAAPSLDLLLAAYDSIEYADPPRRRPQRPSAVSLQMWSTTALMSPPDSL